MSEPGAVATGSTANLTLDPLATARGSDPFVVTSARHRIPKIMNRKPYRLLPALLTILLLFGASQSRGQGPNSAISFTVAMPKPWTHLLEVEMRVSVPANRNVPNETNVIMPVWTPGSYLIREFERNVQDFSADSAGQPLNWTKTNKNTWQIKTNGARQWRVFYRVYANEFSVRTTN